MNQIKNTVDYQQRLRDLRKSIYTKTPPFPGDTPAARAKRIKLAKSDYYFFARTYFKHYIQSDFADFQREEIDKVIQAVRDYDSKIIGEFWFRGSGKSVNFAIGLPIWFTINKLVMFDIFIGKDQKIISERTLAIRAELMYNRALQHDFPDLGMLDKAGEPLAEGEEADFEAPNGARFLALGYKMSIRGRIHMQHRPRYIVVDDLENHLDKNPVISKEKLDYIMGEAFGACGSDGGVIVWLANLTHSQSAANMYVERCDSEPENQDIGYRLVAGVDENGEPTWKAAFTRSRLDRIRSVMGQAEFDRHIMMKPKIEGGVFKEDWLRFYNPYAVSAIKEIQANNRLTRAMKEKAINLEILPGIDELREGQIISYCDPSLGKKESNDYKAIMTVSFTAGLYFILDCYVRRATIREMFDHMYWLNGRYKTRLFMEDNFWQILLWEFIPQIAKEKGYVLPVYGISNTLSKEERILMLQPLFEHGFIHHCTTGKDTQVWKEQLLGYPNMSNDDAPDALSGAIQRYKEVNAKMAYEKLAGRESGDFGRMF
jgi:predicted phage terminase large subunit-like protein